MKTNAGIVKIGKLMYQNQLFNKRYSWEEAKLYADNLRLGGYDDWRLPTRNEIVAILNNQLEKRGQNELWNEYFKKSEGKLLKDKNGKYSFVRSEFVNNMPEFSFFWTIDKYDLERVYLYYFNDLRYVIAFKENQDFVMCVRG